ncbi:hypothetical protein TNCV_2261761 [Trichonephila clavipes]|nr:hypothetical protein TNCV_2261761 [Trichonephila clavipes]
MQGVNSYAEPMKPKPTFALIFVRCRFRVFAGHQRSTQPNNENKNSIRRNARYGMSQHYSRAIAGRADHPLILSTSVGVWRKIHFRG